MKMSFCFIRNLSIYLLSIPIFIFFIFWLNPILSIIGSLLLLYSIFKLTKEDNNIDEKIYIKKYLIIILLILSFGWAYSSGIGGLYWQFNPDWNFRNAMMRDLTQYPWPVIYNNGSALTYYFGFMLFPALIGKTANIWFGMHSFTIANYFALFFSGLCLFILAIQIGNILKIKNQEYFYTFLIFILFSGLDFFINGPDIDWHPPFSYYSNVSFMDMSYHIVIPIWLSMALFIQNYKNIKFYGLITLFFLFYCPQTLLAVIPFMIYFLTKKIYESIKSKNILNFSKETFCIENIFTIIFIAPVFYLYFKSNYSAGNYYFYLNKLDLFSLKCIIFEVCFYLFILFFEFYKDKIFWMLSISLILYPFIAYKTDYDLFLRTSIPLLFVLYIYTIKLLFQTKNRYILKSLMVVIFLMGSYIPLFINKAAIVFFYYYPDFRVKDAIVSFEQKIQKVNFQSDSVFDYKNYVSFDLDEQIFWKYIANKKGRKEGLNR